MTQPSETPRTDEAYVLRLLARIADLERELSAARSALAEKELELVSLREREGWVNGGWRYRHRITGIVTLTEQPPDRVSDLTDYEVTELWARDPMLAAAPSAGGEGKQ